MIEGITHKNTIPKGTINTIYDASLFTITYGVLEQVFVTDGITITNCLKLRQQSTFL